MSNAANVDPSALREHAIATGHACACGCLFSYSAAYGYERECDCIPCDGTACGGWGMRREDEARCKRCVRAAAKAQLVPTLMGVSRCMLGARMPLAKVSVATAEAAHAS